VVFQFLLRNYQKNFIVNTTDSTYLLKKIASQQTPFDNSYQYLIERLQHLNESLQYLHESLQHPGESLQYLHESLQHPG
jgi:hypothetical protein